MENKKILAIVSTPRKGGNSKLLVDAFIKGAKESVHVVDKICLREKKLAPCLACGACLKKRWHLCSKRRYHRSFLTGILLFCECSIKDDD